ncbi:MAG: diaminopimelate decarboxylase [Ruminococcus sp.]|nr:diaminopimelate decarboxylase [Ruminococcus sp.]
MEKRPFISLEQAQDIIHVIPTPFHVYDEKGIRENARALKKAFSWNKGFKEYFAVKATPNPYLMKILQEEGCGMDCSSLTELQLCEACGITGSEIMFSSNVTPVEDMQKAYELGANINLDDYTHVEFIKKVCGVPKIICCRYNPGGVFELSASEDGVQVMDTPGDSKYGMTEEQMVQAFLELKEAGAEEFGIHAFLASNTVSNAYYPELAGILFNLAVRLHQKTGVHIKFVNLSGGIGVDYRPEDPKNDISIIGEGVRKKFEEILVPQGMGDVEIYTELGRYMLAPFGALVTTAIHEKHIYKEYIGVDACAANLMRPAMYGSYHHITVLGKENAPCDHKYDVTGGLCENNDKFAIDRMLPKIEIGDIIYIHDAGAHGFSMGYNYNGKLRSAEVLLCEDGSHKLIRRAETPQDYFATFDFSEFKSLTEQ